MNTVFEYLYRDSSNYKAHGSVILKGALSSHEIAVVRSRLSDDGFFIAEQVGVPALHEKLYRWSGGPTSADHCWHEFVDIRVAEEAESALIIPVWGEAHEFVTRLLEIEVWDERLSLHPWSGIAFSI